MIIPAIMSPIIWGMRNLLSRSGANKIMVSTMKNISTGLVNGSAGRILAISMVEVIYIC